MTSEQRQQIRGLIKKYSASGTESLIAFVAETNGMLAACQSLLQSLNTEGSTSSEWLQRECSNEDVTFHAFLQEVDSIVTLFRPSRDAEDHHATLGVSATAGLDEIKQAYRTLSRRYHPDTASPPYRDNPEKFIAINKAYQALLSVPADNEKGKYIQQEKQWRRKKERRVSPEQRKKVFTWSMGLLIVLVAISVIASMNYKKRAMLAGLQASRGAFIPPAHKAIGALAGQDDKLEKQPTVRAANIATIETPDRNLVTKVQSEPVGDLSSIPLKELTPRDPINTVATPAPPAEEKPNVGQPDESRPHPVKEEQEGSNVVVPSYSTKAIDANIFADQTTNPAVPVNDTKKAKRGKERIVSEQPITAKASSETVAKHASEPRTRMETTGRPAPSPQVQIARNEQSETIRPDAVFKTAVPPDASKPISGKTAKEMRLAGATVTEEVAVDTTPSPIAANRNRKENDLQTRVERFLANYIDAYEQRNLILFSRFFEGEAEENGKPFTSILPTYLDLFATTKHITLQVEKRTWRLVDGMIAVDGQFKVFLEYNDSRKITGSGPIHFLLAENGKELLVKKMDYVFHEE